jgi:hypothetical protein
MMNEINFAETVAIHVSRNRAAVIVVIPFACARQRRRRHGERKRFRSLESVGTLEVMKDFELLGSFHLGFLAGRMGIPPNIVFREPGADRGLADAFVED